MKMKFDELPAIGYGCLQLSYPDEVSNEDATRLIQQAYNQGVRVFDTAASYGRDRHNEKILGSALKELDIVNDEEPFIITKCGLCFGSCSLKFPQKPDEIYSSVTTSLEKLGLDTIDLLILHRIDNNASDLTYKKTIQAMKTLVLEKKVRFIGLSETSADRIREAHHTDPVNVPITAVESAYSIFTRRAEVNGVWDTCHELGIKLIAYTSVVRGAVDRRLQSLTSYDLNELSYEKLKEKVFNLLNISKRDVCRSCVGFFDEQYIRNNIKQVLELQRLADELKITPSQLSLAWLQHRGVIAIPGTKNAAHLKENADVLQMQLPDEALNTLSERFPLGCFKGDPNPAMFRTRDDEKLEVAYSLERNTPITSALESTRQSDKVAAKLLCQARAAQKTNGRKRKRKTFNGLPTAFDENIENMPLKNLSQ